MSRFEQKHGRKRARRAPRTAGGDAFTGRIRAELEDFLSRPEEVTPENVNLLCSRLVGLSVRYAGREKAGDLLETAVSNAPRLLDLLRGKNR